MLKPLIVLSLSLLLVVLLSAQQKQATPPAKSSFFTVPVAAEQKENPVKPTPESLARAKKLYGYDCAMCHGKEGNGKGEVAADMKLKMHDETDPATLKDFTDGALFYIIKNGKDQMPPEGDRTKTEGIWELVNYVRSFAKKQAPAEDKASN
jgi:mono/diheme cytochrome c family protein